VAFCPYTIIEKPITELINTVLCFDKNNLQGLSMDSYRPTALWWCGDGPP